MNDQANQKRALLVDDDCIVRTAHRRSLLEAGFVVEEAENGQQAIECFVNHNGHFSIVLMDYDMPDMTGADVTKELRRIEGHGKQTSIIGITANEDEGIKTICLNAGMNDIFSKPLLQLQLTKLLQSCHLTH